MEGLILKATTEAQIAQLTALKILISKTDLEKFDYNIELEKFLLKEALEGIESNTAPQKEKEEFLLRLNAKNRI